jgi:hypothetical protein
MRQQRQRLDSTLIGQPESLKDHTGIEAAVGSLRHRFGGPDLGL